jgi:hypothetical protein
MIALALAALLQTGPHTPPRVDVDDAHPVTGPERLPLEESRSVWPWIVAGAIGVLILLVARRWGKVPAPEPSPEDWARRQLAQLAARNGDCHALADDLAAVIRSYFQRRYHTATDGLTTHELVGTLRKAGVGEKELAPWHGVLNRCDLAKFARMRFTTDESAEILRRAQTLLPTSLPIRESPSPE